MGLKRDMIGDFSTSHFADHPRAVPAGDDHRGHYWGNDIVSGKLT